MLQNTFSICTWVDRGSIDDFYVLNISIIVQATSLHDSDLYCQLNRVTDTTNKLCNHPALLDLGRILNGRYFYVRSREVGIAVSD